MTAYPDLLCITYQLNCGATTQMNVTEAKHDEIERLDLLYNEQRIMALHEQYGDATEIKKHVKTTAVVYEIHTALRFWNDKTATHRTNDCLWDRLQWFKNDDIGPEGADYL